MSSNLTFRVRSQNTVLSGQKKATKTDITMMRLSCPKVEYVPKDPFLYSDFRGLLNADFKEALTNTFKQDDLNKLNLEKNRHSHYEAINKSSTSNLLDSS